MELYQIIYNKVPNTTTGEMHNTWRFVGEEVYIGADSQKITRLSEEMDKNDRPVVNIYFTGGYMWSVPDRGIEKYYRDPTQIKNKNERGKNYNSRKSGKD